MIVFVVVGILLLVVFLFAVTAWQTHKARQAIGPVALFLEPDAPRLGETCGACVRLSRPQPPLHLLRIELHVAGYEWIRWTESRRSGKTSTTVTRTKRHTFHQERFMGGHSGALSGPHEETYAFTIPPDAPPSFATPDNKIVWEVVVKVFALHHPPQDYSFELEVPPVLLRI